MSDDWVRRMAEDRARWDRQREQDARELETMRRNQQMDEERDRRRKIQLQRDRDELAASQARHAARIAAAAADTARREAAARAASAEAARTRASSAAAEQERSRRASSQTGNASCTETSSSVGQISTSSTTPKYTEGSKNSQSGGAGAGIAAATVAGGLLLVGSFFSGGDKNNPPPKELPVTLHKISEDALVYAGDGATLGMIKKNTCVTAIVNPTRSFSPVGVTTSEGRITAVVLTRLLSEKFTGASENCKNQLYQVYADPSKPATKETANLPLAGFYTLVAPVQLHWTENGSSSGLMATSGCVEMLSPKMTEGNRLYVRVWFNNERQVDDFYVNKLSLRPYGAFSFDIKCRAVISGTVTTNRPREEPKSPSHKQTAAEPIGNKAERNIAPLPRNDETIARAMGANDKFYLVKAEQLNLRQDGDSKSPTLAKFFEDSCLMSMGTRKEMNGYVPVLAMYGGKHMDRGYVSTQHVEKAPAGTNMQDCIAFKAP